MRVVICSPNHLHESHILAALSANLHVLVEKPLAHERRRACSGSCARPKSGTACVMVGMNHRYRPDVQIVRSFVQSGELGRIESVRGSWHVFRPSRTQLGWRQRRDQSGGGAMLDLGLSMLDLGPVARREPGAGPGQREPGRGGQASARSSSRAARSWSARAGISLFVDVTWHHLGEGERFGVGLRGSKGIAAINPLIVWKELHGMPDRRVAHRLGQPREPVHRLVPRRVGPLRGRDRRRGQGSATLQEHLSSSTG